VHAFVTCWKWYWPSSLALQSGWRLLLSIVRKKSLLVPVLALRSARPPPLQQATAVVRLPHGSR
jgi:hypothetical protein